MVCNLTGAPPLAFRNLPILTHLTFTASRTQPSVGLNVQKATVDLSSIPKLQHLSLNGYICVPMIRSGVILSDLTTLCLEYGIASAHFSDGPTEVQRFPDGSDCMNILRRAPFLEEVHITLCPFGNDALTDLREGFPVSLDHLTRMKISYKEALNSRSMSHLLRNVSAPSLELLDFENVSFGNAIVALQQDVFQELVNFIIRSNMTLSGLVLRLHCEFQFELVNNILQQLPNLLHLHIHFPIISTAFLSMLIQALPSSTEFALCPRLQTIYFEEYETRMAVDPGELDPADHAVRLNGLLVMLRVISRRWNVPSPDRSLRTAVIKSLVARSEKMGDWDEVKNLTSEGLRFRLAPGTWPWR